MNVQQHAGDDTKNLCLSWVVINCVWIQLTQVNEVNTQQLEETCINLVYYARPAWTSKSKKNAVAAGDSKMAF